MGIIDFFKRRKERNSNVNYSGKPKNYDCSLQYHSGIIADVYFGELEDVTLDNASIKRLQRVRVIYNKPDNTFELKNMYMDPISDSNGNNITKESYLNLLAQNKSLVKVFFEIGQVKKQPTNYIGHIGYNREGNPIRGKDTNFEAAYKRHLDRKKAKAHEEYEERFNQQLQKQIKEAPFHDDTNNQPEDLSKYRYDELYNHPKSSNNDFTR